MALSETVFDGCIVRLDQVIVDVCHTSTLTIGNVCNGKYMNMLPNMCYK